VITAVSRTAKCGSSLAWNTITLKTYAGLASFTACAPLHVAGYLITAVSNTAACQGIGVVIKDRTVTFPAYNTVTLAAYQGLKAITVCAPLPNIPSGYVVTAHSTRGVCKLAQGGLVAWNAMTLTAYAGLATFNACMPLSPIPSGYVVTAQIRTAACGGAPGVNTVTLKRL
jgi:hypothetical protein